MLYHTVLTPKQGEGLYTSKRKVKEVESKDIPVTGRGDM
jgi:hypothetical protein